MDYTFENLEKITPLELLAAICYPLSKLPKTESLVAEIYLEFETLGPELWRQVILDWFQCFREREKGGT